MERAGLDCEKADSEPGSGLVHQKMLDSILRADVVIADIATSNANVFYELGVRHTARPSGTIMICRRLELTFVTAGDGGGACACADEVALNTAMPAIVGAAAKAVDGLLIRSPRRPA